ncbi:hypothetical protein [Amycolatopsis sp. CA-230715]|uniref:hypothetical protein n=1 Tax=Amycolatopsis sp. CA-230715 TaxID=2745196 RepID=UPI001C023251|nr:hypothetical protein [Amycolatopsis sp. CA-230715]
MGVTHQPGIGTRLAAASPPPEIVDLDLDAELAELEELSRDLETHTLAANTRHAYAKAWRSFTGFCATHALEALPAHPTVIRWYVAWMARQADDEGTPRFAVTTIRQHLAGIADRHLGEGYLDPTGHRAVGDLVRGLGKLRATRPTRKKPLVLDDIVRVIAAMEHDRYPAGISAARDTVALWLGFAGALRRSEAAGLRLSSLDLHPRDGIHVRVGKSKADQANVLPDVVVLPFGASPRTCAPCAVHRWVALVRGSGIEDARARRRASMRCLYEYQLDDHVCGVGGDAGLISGADLTSPTPLLRATYRNRRDARIHESGISGDALCSMLHTRMTEAGMNPAGYGFHSLRAGHVTHARRNGATTEEVMRACRIRKADTVTIYDREFNPAARNSVMRLGL